jgi:type I restriction enzyme S subunit
MVEEKVREGYRRTEVGLIPENWEEKKLDEICIYKNGKAQEKNTVKDGKYNLITLNSININGELKSNHEKVNDFDWLLQKNDLVMVLSDVATGAFLGLTDIIPDHNYVLNQRMGLLRVKEEYKDIICIQLLRYIINFNQKYFNIKGQGSSQKNLSKNGILEFSFYLPNIKEQKAIAQILSDMDSEIEALNKKLEKYKKIKQGMMEELLTGRVRLV